MPTDRVTSPLGTMSTTDPRLKKTLLQSPRWVVCLCGSTRFWREYQQANRDETRKGYIVLTVGFFVHRPAGEPLEPGLFEDITAAEKAELDELHLRKIDLADEVLFLNVGGYMGESTRNELAYAREQGKVLRFIEPVEGELAS